MATCYTPTHRSKNGTKLHVLRRLETVVSDGCAMTWKCLIVHWLRILVLIPHTLFAMCDITTLLYNQVFKYYTTSLISYLELLSFPLQTSKATGRGGRRGAKAKAAEEEDKPATKTSARGGKKTTAGWAQLVSDLFVKDWGACV